MVYPDTSFLFSLLLFDANSGRVVDYLRRHPARLALSPWQRCEVSNAFRLAVFRGHCSLAAARRALDRLPTGIEDGNLLAVALDWPALLDRTESLGARYTAKLGIRTLDLLHVAAAIELEAKTFLTCDDRQKALARAVGLAAPKI